jgi:hypothetical protein
MITGRYVSGAGMLLCAGIKTHSLAGAIEKSQGSCHSESITLSCQLITKSYKQSSNSNPQPALDAQSAVQAAARTRTDAAAGLLAGLSIRMPGRRRASCSATPFRLRRSWPIGTAVGAAN